MKHFILCIAIFIGYTSQVLAQETADIPSTNKWKVQLNLQHQSNIFDIPVGRLGIVDPVRIRPYIGAEIQRVFPKKKEHKRRIVSAQLSYFNNTYHDRWTELKLGIGSERHIGENFYMTCKFEAGMARIQNSDVQYIHDGKIWIVTDNYSEPFWSPVFSPRLDIGYKAIKGEHPLDIALSTNIKLNWDPVFWFYWPYSAIGFSVRYGL